MIGLSRMISRRRSPFRFKRCLAILVSFAGSVSVPCFAHTTFLKVDNTPYDRQMAPVWVFLNADSPAKSEATTLFTLNDWMRRLRAMPYRYSKAWKTPAEVQSDRVGDCKGKAVALYEKLLANGAHNVRLVIGKHRTTDLRTHAWVEWETAQGTLLLDPTLNWTVTTTECQDAIDLHPTLRVRERLQVPRAKFRPYRHAQLSQRSGRIARLASSSRRAKPPPSLNSQPGAIACRVSHMSARSRAGYNSSQNPTMRQT